MSRKRALSESESAVLTSIAHGENGMGNYWAGTIAHLKKRGLVFYGRIAGKCVVYLTPVGLKAAWALEAS